MGPQSQVTLRLSKIFLILAIITLQIVSKNNATPYIRRLGSEGAYKISPKPCRIGSEPNARTGTCMFVWECLKSEGKHLGMCVDGFMFGSCCGHNDTSNDIHPVETESEAVSSSTIVSDTLIPPRPLIPSVTDTSAVSTTTTTRTVMPSSPSSTTVAVTSTTTVRPDEMETKPRPQSQPAEESFPFVTSNNSFFQLPQKLPERLPISTTTTTARPETTTTEEPTTTTTTPQPPTTTAEVTTETTESDFCGKAPLYPQMRIVGGKQSALGQFPWIASVRRTSFFGFSSTHRCGGALLNSAWVATAGHCVDDLLATQIRVRLGEWDFSGTDEKYPHVESAIVKKVVHPSYNFFTYENDLALLKLEKPIQFSKYIRPICLPGNQDLLIGENATVAGWGRLTENGQLPSRLQHVTVPIMSNTKCRELFLKSNRVEHIPDIFLCAGFEKGGQDSCQGDSGGPLQVKGRDGRYFLGGIISWGIGCAEANMPGVCTRISKFTDWIMANVT